MRRNSKKRIPRRQRERHRSNTARLCVMLVGWLTCVGVVGAWTPGTGSPNAVDGFVVNPMNRTDVLAFYNTVYPASENYAANMAWTGDVPTGVAGTTSATFKDDVRRRINFFRALVGLPADITFDATKSAKCQQAALMMARNNALNHYPPANWIYYTADGYEAAGNSNLALGLYGPPAINGLIADTGVNNEVVGHRRWIFYPRAQVMGTGDVPADSPYLAAHASWVIGDFKPAPAPQFVEWPNEGYAPFQFIPARWSLSYPGANFINADVTMTQGGNNVPVNIVSNSATGVGDNTLVWEPTVLPTSISADIPYNITVSEILGSGVPTSHTYTVTFFDPSQLGEIVTIAGTSTPPTAGAPYTFNAITQADAYELRVATAAAAAWTEGAEDAPTPQIEQHTTGVYPLRQTAIKRTGAKAFQLAFPDFNDQSFQLTHDLIPSASSQLQFYERARGGVATCTFHAEASTNGGNTWTSLYSRNGAGLSSVGWDTEFFPRNLSLAAFAGQLTRIRFIFRWNGGSVAIGTSSSHGFFIDDVTVTNTTELVNTAVTPLAGNATSFNLNAGTAGAALIAGTSYYMRVRPKVGTRWFPDGPFKIATPQALSGYAAWIASQYPTVTGGPNADHEGDGLRNGVEYAFALNPTVANPTSAVPQPVLAGNSYSVTFTEPPGVTGVTYGAVWSTDMVTWTTIPDTGAGTTHTFTVNTAGQHRVFFGHQITIAP